MQPFRNMPPGNKAQHQKTAATADQHKTHRTIKRNTSDQILIHFLHALNLQETIKRITTTICNIKDDLQLLYKVLSYPRITRIER